MLSRKIIKKEPNYTCKVQPLKGLKVIVYVILAMNVQRMGLKMEFIGANMKNMKNNETIMNSFQSMATAVGYVNNPNFEQMAGNMQNF